MNLLKNFFIVKKQNIKIIKKDTKTQLACISREIAIKLIDIIIYTFIYI